MRCWCLVSYTFHHIIHSNHIKQTISFICNVVDIDLISLNFTRKKVKPCEIIWVEHYTHTKIYKHVWKIKLVRFLKSGWEMFSL